jgi:drug/metabolite transporter (DMT)-like permease
MSGAEEGEYRLLEMSTPLTNTGSRPAAYGPAEWSLTLVIGIIWGSAFLWIALGVENLAPSIVAFGRVALGALALAMFPMARRRVHRSDWPLIAVIAVVGNAGPAWLFAQAETELDSAVAGMITAGTPVLALVVASLMLWRLPGLVQVIGIVMGFFGIVLMSLPSLIGAEATPVGVVLVLVATVGYALNSNLIVPLQQRYGGPAVVMWALVVSSGLLAPFAVGGISRSTFTPGSLIAVIILGVVGTGIARALAATLAGRVGGPRMSSTTYLVPIVAIVLGVVFLGERVAPVAIFGVVVVLAGAYWTTRAVPATISPGSASARAGSD